ncbi:MAG: DNA-binding protein, partial [Pseudomonadota bacterium]
SLIRNDKALALLHATDGAGDGLRKLRQSILSATGREDGIELLRTFSAEQMSLALGANHVIHAAITTGGAAKNALSRIRQLELYRSG